MHKFWDINLCKIFCIFRLTNLRRCDKMAVRSHAARTEFTIIPRLAKFVKSFCENIYFFIFPKMLDFYGWVWYYNHVRRGNTPHETDRHQLQNGKQIGRGWKVIPKNFSKLFEKVLTRLAECAIISM